MTGDFHIVVEGKEDRMFMLEYLRHINLHSSVPEFIKNLGGIGRLGGHTQKIQEHLNEDIKVLIVADANSNHEERRKSIEKIISSEIKARDVPLFLFPNNQSEGTLENLLEQIILAKHRDIFTCVENYEKCLKNINNDYLFINLKGKIYGYKEAIGAIKEEKPYAPKYWDFDHPALDPLKKFLTDNIQ